jgi:hypothetical protein
VAQRQRTDQTARLSLRGEVTGTAGLQFTGEGVVRVLDDAVSMQFTEVVTLQGAAPQEVGFILLPDAAYLRPPVPAGQPAPARPWMRVDRTSTDPVAKRLAALVTTLTDSADPTLSLHRYAATTRIAGAAPDTVDGVPTVRYAIVVDLAKAAAQESDPTTKAQLQEQVRAGLSVVTSTLWLDALNRPVRSEVRQVLPGGTLSLTGSYRDWGRPVEIDAPPASQVR